MIPTRDNLEYPYLQISIISCHKPVCIRVFLSHFFIQQNILDAFDQEKPTFSHGPFHMIHVSIKPRQITESYRNI